MRQLLGKTTSKVVKDKPKSTADKSSSSLLVTREEYYRRKMFGFVHLYNGEEAVSTRQLKLLLQKDYVTSTYRDHLHALSKGVPAREVMSELFGKTTGCCRGQGGWLHVFSRAARTARRVCIIRQRDGQERAVLRPTPESVNIIVTCLQTEMSLCDSPSRRSRATCVAWLAPASTKNSPNRKWTLRFSPL